MINAEMWYSVGDDYCLVRTVLPGVPRAGDEICIHEAGGFCLYVERVEIGHGGECGVTVWLAEKSGCTIDGLVGSGWSKA